MKNLLFCFILLFSSHLCSAQFFQASILSSGNDLIFNIRPNPSGGDITTSWSDMEFFVRWPNSASSFNFGTITINTSDFPGISIPNNGSNAQGTEVGYTNNWFGTSFAVSPATTYLDGVEYEVFRVTLDIPAGDVNFQLVHNSFFSPHYLALVDGSGSDVTNPSGIMFYGPNAQICSPNCPASTPGSNHVDGGGLPLPVELLSFSAKPINNEKVLLEWQTASEINNDFFAIEHSADGVHFNEINRVSGAGTHASRIDYKTYDETPVWGINYYRLRQVDLDGSIAYSEMRSVNFKSEAGEVNVYPNPTNGLVTVQWPESKNYQVLVYNASGQLLISADNPEKLDLSGLTQGIYQLQFLDHHGQSMVNKQVVKY